ncbi:MAG: QueT transporter family protein [Ruminococcaceae bacterium]|nr:QueT transporter family protein [Oscillospiraceae bacterium]
MNKLTTRRIATAAVVGALYTVLTVFGSVFGITFGPIQCRFSEALCVLPFLFPETAWGLGIGCLISNILSPYGVLDMVVGSLTTLVAALLTARCRSRYLAPLPPVVLNGLFIGAMLAFEEVGFTDAFPRAFWFNGASVAAGEAVACFVLGLLLLKLLPAIPFFRHMIAERAEQ